MDNPIVVLMSFMLWSMISTHIWDFAKLTKVSIAELGNLYESCGDPNCEYSIIISDIEVCIHPIGEIVMEKIPFKWSRGLVP